MSVILSKGQDIALENKAHELNNIYLGAGWGTKSTGGVKLLGMQVVNPQEKDVDLDISCLLFNTNQDLLDKVWFEKLRSDCGAVVHAGDSPAGGGGVNKDNERIQLRLKDLAANVKHIIFLINNFSGESFKGLSHAFCRVIDRDKKEELVRFELDTHEDFCGIIMVKIYRNLDQWKIQAIGEKLNHRTFDEMMPQIKKHVY